MKKDLSIEGNIKISNSNLGKAFICESYLDGKCGLTNKKNCDGCASEYIYNDKI